ncbi:MAG: non-hydrolyzing UDP-N-acetylglucosamine 2-epimerase [bacterium]
MKVLTVFGTRPEAIKMAPVIKKLEVTKGFESIVCVSAQHREMLDHALDIFNIQPHIDLNIMRNNQSLYDVTSRIILGMHEVLKKEMPDIVLVQGDTTTAFATALSAFYAKISIGHIEAGLRTGDLYAPFPEEANRILVGRLADFHFAPTEGSKENLLIENISQDKIFVTGNTVIDALLMTLNKVANQDPAIWAGQFGAALPIIKDNSKRIILVTGHRRENFGQGFKNICEALSLIADRFKDVDLIYPVHLNPNVRKPVMDMLKNNINIHLIDPLQYAPFVYLLNRSYLILTDSGGIQEEAPSLGKPVLVMREVTERPEAVEAGTAILVGTDHEKIYENTSRLLTDNFFYNKMAQAHNPYGDGKASERITEILSGIMINSDRTSK